MKKLLVLLFCGLSLAGFAQKAEDIKAIKSMAGYYKVTFDYSETFSPDTAYTFHPKYHTYGYEWVFVAEEKPGKIVLQHILAVDTMVVKHWRQDWIYENKEILTFQQNDTWNKNTLTPAQAKGTWTQKVYSIDDSPRYENYGTWVHADGKHFWISETDAPLPRREYTKRRDYNVLHRRSFIHLTSNGWMFEQDNQKIARSEASDKLIAWEKGFENFEKADESHFTYAKKWWDTQKNYWAVVREAWDEIFTTKSQIKIEKKVNGKTLSDKLFELGELTASTTQKNLKEQVKSTILPYLK